jgi:hypothetical protein
MLQIPITLIISICSFFPATTATLEKPTEIVEVIQSLPTHEMPTWQIGNVQYSTDDATVILEDNLPVIGNLAIVTYIASDNNNVAIEITPLSLQANEVDDGPYIFFDENDLLISVSMNKGTIQKFEFPFVHGTRHIVTPIPSLPSIAIASTSTSTPSDTYALPPKLLAVSDLEGNLDYLIEFLQIHNVIDEKFNWSWGTNHVLFNGDSVDRGDQVTELLWFMRKLQQQALKAGGNVHVVLGNHEAMILADDIRYTHPKYKFVAARIGIPYHQLFNKISILGNWLRAQNSVVQVGPYLFTHAGYGPELYALQLSKKEINTSIRKSLGPPAWANKTDLSKSLAWHRKGPLWYRGYFQKHSEQYGPKPTDEELDAILSKHQASAIIVGHTVTGTVGWLDGDKRLIGIDVHWDTHGQGQGLLITDGKLFRATMTEANAELINIPTSN